MYARKHNDHGGKRSQKHRGCEEKDSGEEREAHESKDDDLHDDHNDALNGTRRSSCEEDDAFNPFTFRRERDLARTDAHMLACDSDNHDPMPSHWLSYAERQFLRACARGDSRQVHAVLQANPDSDLLDSSDASGRRPLHLAAISGSVKACRVLLEHAYSVVYDECERRGRELQRHIWQARRELGPSDSEASLKDWIARATDNLERQCALLREKKHRQVCGSCVSV
jgi:ankyrin repeat protein